MSIHRQVARVQRAGVLDEVPRHPVVFARAGDVLNQLAKIAAMELRTAFARGADETDCESRVVRHRDERSLAVAREPLDPDLLGVHGLVGLEVIECTAGPPCPRTQRSPIIGLAGLALVAQADDALGQARAVVGLDAVGDDDGIAPALGEKLLLPGRAAATGAKGPAVWSCLGRRLGCSLRGAGPPGPEPAEPELHHHRHRAGRFGRGCQRQLDVNGDLGI